MKPSLILILLVSLKISAQKPLQFIKVKNPDRTVDLSVINHSGIDYSVTINMELEKMTCDKKLPITVEIAAGTTMPLAKLTPTSEQPGKYLINYRSSANQPLDLTYEPNLTIYTKNKDKRSTQLLIYLNQNGIAYNEINTSYNGDTKAMYERMLTRRGIDKKEARIPVVIYRGEAYPDIKNVKKFCKEKLANEGHFIRKQDRKY
ncbi:hypothetical protein [Portibacter marinus]|uniref:hypothetical protein n=1 Tax=Portibacter marinus TaxID=2898660 RepID=UPI001F178418|nr:hypothetical protein [Portibacter marinus]